MVKHSEIVNDMEFNIPLDQLQTMDVWIKAVTLAKIDKEPQKVMMGFKFSPKIQLTPESKQSVEDMIKNGEHLKNYRDFVSGKIASYYTATKIVEMSGFIAGCFCKGQDKKEKIKELAEALLRGYERGVIKNEKR